MNKNFWFYKYRYGFPLELVAEDFIAQLFMKTWILLLKNLKIAAQMVLPF